MDAHFSSFVSPSKRALSPPCSLHLSRTESAARSPVVRLQPILDCQLLEKHAQSRKGAARVLHNAPTPVRGFHQPLGSLRLPPAPRGSGKKVEAEADFEHPRSVPPAPLAPGAGAGGRETHTALKGLKSRTGMNQVSSGRPQQPGFDPRGLGFHGQASSGTPNALLLAMERDRAAPTSDKPTKQQRLKLQKSTPSCGPRNLANMDEFQLRPGLRRVLTLTPQGINDAWRETNEKFVPRDRGL